MSQSGIHLKLPDHSFPKRVHFVFYSLLTRVSFVLILLKCETAVTSVNLKKSPLEIYLPDLICYLLKIMFNSPIFVFFSCWFVANFEVWPKCIKGVKKKIILNNKTYLVFKLCSLVDLKQYQFVSNSCSIRVQFVTILIRIVLHSHIS